MNTDITVGPISGRFYRHKNPPSPGCSLLDAIADSRWHEHKSTGKAFHLGWCRPDPPYDGEIECDPEKLLYADDGHGIWRCVIRQDRRMASRAAVESMAAKLATDQDPDQPLGRRQSHEKKEFYERAKTALLKMALPQIRIVHVVLTTQWIWVGARDCDDVATKALLRQIAGGVMVDPVAWSPGLPETEAGAEGWNELSLATLLVLPHCDGNDLTTDVSLREVTIKGDSIRIKSQQDALIVREAISTLTKAVQDVNVDRLSFEVTLHGGQVSIDLDCHGLYRAEPAGIAGGFFHEGVQRRFDDALAAAKRAGDVMRECRDRIKAAAV